VTAPEEVARRYRTRPGYRLADYAGVGLPIYAVNIRALTIARKKIRPTEEFVLKCLDRGLSVPEEIAAFLGLENHVVKGILVDLAQSESIALLAAPGSRTQSLRLTQKGRLTLDKAETELPEERVFAVHYDALLKRPAWYGRLETLKFEELERQGLIEIQAFPPKRPRVYDLDIAQLGRVIRVLGNPDEYRRELVAVKGIERIQKLFLPAVALVYISLDGNDVQVAFAVDEKIAAEHENSFARMDGPRKQGIVQSIRRLSSESDSLKELAESLPEPAAETKNLQAAAYETEANLQETRAKLVSAGDSSEQAELATKLKTLEEQHERLKQELAQAVVTYLYTLDHPPLLDDALNNAKNRLLILSPWIRGEIVDSSFLQRLERLLSAGVRVYIGYGINETPTANPDIRDQSAQQNLLKLSQRYPHFRFVRLGNTHSKVLIKDSDYAVVGSFNWLSFKGDPARKFRDEQSIKIQRPELVESKFSELVGRFS
jgi:hypothetical protein